MIFRNGSGKKFEADFDGGEITSNAGALLLRETEKQKGIIYAISSVIRGTRDLHYVDHSIADIITQRVNQIACGYEDSNDSDVLRSDPSLKISANRLPLSGQDLASQPTVSRLENTVRRDDLVRMGYLGTLQFIRKRLKPALASHLVLAKITEIPYTNHSLTPSFLSLLFLSFIIVTYKPSKIALGNFRG